MTATRFDIEKFDGVTKFQSVASSMAILVQIGLKKVVTGKKSENLD
ncbi:hypothetical protein Gotur_006888 [Gossypium turneri]